MSIIFIILALILTLSITLMAVSGLRSKPKMALGIAAGMVLLVASTYIVFGRPDLTKPHAASIETMTARAKANLDKTRDLYRLDPNTTVDQWAKLSSQYWDIGDMIEAAKTLEIGTQSIKDAKGRDTLMAAQAQVLIMANNNQVDDKAKALLEDILTRAPDNLRALFFLGLAAEQKGDMQGTKKYWSRVLALAPQDSTLRKTLLARINRQKNPPPKKAISIPPGPQREMIEGMVAKLANRLRAEGGTAPEWARLGRSYAVLGQTDKAISAYNKARKLDPDNAEKYKAVLDSLTPSKDAAPKP